MDNNKKITDEQAANVSGGLGYNFGDNITPVDYDITVFYCEKNNPSVVKTVWVTVTVGTKEIDAARAWCEANNKIYKDWVL